MKLWNKFCKWFFRKEPAEGGKYPDWYPQMMKEIDDAIFERKKVNAIKARRTWTGEGLKEAKAFVDNRVRMLQEEGHDV